MRNVPAVILILFLLCTLIARSEESADSIAPTDALSVLREQAKAGDTEAMNYLGFMLLSGEEGVERDSAEGLSWLVKAASAGDVKAASNLGWLYLDGNLVEQDLQKGAAWLEKASQAGLPVAQSLLGDLYREGRGVEKSALMADSLYREAFEHGLYDAGYKLYDLNAERYATLPASEQVKTGKYFYLRGAPSEGVKLFYLAADKGDADAYALLGDAYSRAYGVPYDYDLSLKYYAMGAMAGNPSAQFIIGELLEIFPDALLNLDSEDFREPLIDDPFFWYEKAGEGGISDAAMASDRLLN